MTSSNDSIQGQDAGASTLLSPTSCMFSIYLVSFSHAMIMMGSRKGFHRKFSSLGLMTTTSRLLDEFGSNGLEITPDKSFVRRRNTVDSNEYEEETSEMASKRAGTMKLALQVR